MLKRKSSFREPCLCGAPDCPRCFPFTWRQSAAQCDEGAEDEERPRDDDDDLDAPDADDPNEEYEPRTEREERGL